MTKIGILMIGYAGLAIIPGCMAESPEETQTSASTSALTAAPDVAPSAIGAFHTIRLVNTTLCLRPQGGSTAPVVPVEIHACDPNALDQNWSFQGQPGGRIAIVNVASGNCIYDNAPLLPLTNGAMPIDVESCFVSTNPGVFSSGALWKQRNIFGSSSFESEIQFRDTGFCIEVPGIPFDGVGFWNWGCNGSPGQLLSVE
jgi:hypothetical protein